MEHDKVCACDVSAEQLQSGRTIIRIQWVFYITLDQHHNYVQPNDKHKQMVMVKSRHCHSKIWIHTLLCTEPSAVDVQSAILRVMSCSSPHVARVRAMACSADGVTSDGENIGSTKKSELSTNA